MVRQVVPEIGELRTRDGAQFERAISTQIAPLKFAPSTDPFFGRFRWSQAQHLHVGRATNATVRAHSLGISRNEPPRFVFCFQVSGSGTIEQEGRHTHISENQVSLYRSDKPYELAFPSTGERVGVAISVHALGVSLDRLNRLTGTRLDAASPLLSSVSQSIIAYERALHCVPAAQRLAVFDLIVTTLRTSITAISDEDQLSPRELLFERACTLIDSSLADPDLSPRQLAESLFVSTRSLQEAFAAAGCGIAQIIRERRLQQAARELTDPALSHLTVGEIAQRSGFTSPSHFAALVRRQFGASPSSLRRTSLTT